MQPLSYTIYCFIIFILQSNYQLFYSVTAPSELAVIVRWIVVFVVCFPATDPGDHAVCYGTSPGSKEEERRLGGRGGTARDFLFLLCVVIFFINIYLPSFIVGIIGYTRVAVRLATPPVFRAPHLVITLLLCVWFLCWRYCVTPQRPIGCDWFEALD